MSILRFPRERFGRIWQVAKSVRAPCIFPWASRTKKAAEKNRGPFVAPHFFSYAASAALERTILPISPVPPAGMVTMASLRRR